MQAYVTASMQAHVTVFNLGQPWASSGNHMETFGNFGRRTVGNLWGNFENLWETVGDLWEREPFGTIGEPLRTVGKPLGTFGKENLREPLGNL